MLTPDHVRTLALLRDLGLPPMRVPVVGVVAWQRAWRVAVKRRRNASTPRAELN